jgi:replicative DNA helicase
MIDVRPAPNSIEAEESLLGSILIEPDTIYKCRDLVQPIDFFIMRNRWIYEAMLDLCARSMPIDFVTLGRALEARAQLGEIGGTPALSRLMTIVPTAIHAYGYARMIVGASVRRGLLAAASEIAKMAYDESEDVEAQKARALYLLTEIRCGHDMARPVAEVASKLYDQIVEWSKTPLAPGHVRGMSTGFRAIDVMLGGLERRQLYILAGRPGMGKSAFAGQVAHNSAKQGRRVAFFSIEMSAQQILSRLVCADARVAWEAIKRGVVPEDKWEVLTDKISDVSNLPIVIDDSSRTTTARIESAVSKLGQVDLIVVDHLGLLGDAGMRGENETIRLGRMSWALKQIAKDYNVPVLCLCQLNRSVDSRENKRPMLSDLRQSGNIEENADAVLMIYREDYYTIETENKNTVEILPRKLRDGDVDGVAMLYFEKQYCHFAEIERHLLGSI